MQHHKWNQVIVRGISAAFEHAIRSVRLAENLWLKVLFVDSLREKNIIRWLKSTAYKTSEHGDIVCNRQSMAASMRHQK
jgi:hypothetical protein